MVWLSYSLTHSLRGEFFVGADWRWNSENWQRTVPGADAPTIHRKLTHEGARPCAALSQHVPLYSGNGFNSEDAFCIHDGDDSASMLAVANTLPYWLAEFAIRFWPGECPGSAIRFWPGHPGHRAASRLWAVRPSMMTREGSLC